MAEFDLLSETKACDLLARLFRARGYAIARHISFREYGVSFHIDGWDAKARVGFEFLTSEDEDHDDLTLREYQTLMAAQQRGELALMILDEVEPLSVADLKAMADEFLDEAAAAAKAQAASRRRTTPKAAGKKPAKAAVKKKPATKVAAAKNVAKTAAKTPAKTLPQKSGKPKQAPAKAVRPRAAKPAGAKGRSGRSR
jgi:hypothetical protein